MKRLLPAFILLFLITTFLFADEKPLFSGYVITGGFGDNRTDHFHTGIDLAARDKSVPAINDSELIFHNSNRPGTLRYGLGDFAVYHDSSTDMQVLYAHLLEGTLKRDQTIVKRGEDIAIVGTSGYSTGPHLHMEIDDTAAGRLVNPFLSLDFVDTVKPRIIDVEFHSESGKVTSLLERHNVQVERKGRLYIDTRDSINASPFSITPWSIEVYLDGDLRVSMTFDYLSRQQDKFLLSDTGKSFETLYSDGRDFYYYISNLVLLPGLTGLKIIVSDYQGNKTVFKRNLRISK
jgi:hypothetical protein